MSITDPLIGSQLGDYRILDLLGRGGMARVYHGYDPKLERYAAVKVIDAHTTHESEADYRERFRREARSIARLNHPRIVGIYQFGEAGSLYYMAMAFIEGRDLGQVLRELATSERLMSQREVLQIARDIASALDHAHAGGVIHRDVKPSNIMVTADGHAVLTDFGLALSVREGSIGNSFGSAHYIAPEQALSSANAGPRSDLYSLGVVLYQMLTGRVPFDDASPTAVALKHVNEPVPAPTLYNPALSNDVEAVLLRVLAKDPAQRFESGAALIRALERAFAQADMATQGLSRPRNGRNGGFLMPQDDTRPSAQRRGMGRRILAPVLLALLAVVAGIGGLALLLAPGSGDAKSGMPTTAGNTARASATSTRPATQTSMTTRISTRTPTTNPAPAVMAPTAADTATPNEIPTATERPTETPSLPPPTLTPDTRTAGSATPSGAPKTAEETPEVTDEPRGTRLELVYDEASLTLINPADEPVDASDLQFARTTEGGGTLSFRSNVWQNADALQGHSCFQVWTDAFIQRPVPEFCGERQSWQAVSFVRWFWISSDPNATFEVRRGTRLLATCRIGDGACTVYVD